MKQRIKININKWLKLGTYLFIATVLTFSTTSQTAFARENLDQDDGRKNLGAGKNGDSDEFRLQGGGQNFTTKYYDGSGNPQHVDFTHPNINGAPAPVIIFVPGGGWLTDDGNYNDAFRARIAKEGYASFRIKYRLGPNGIWRVMNDLGNAIENVKNNADKYNIDPHLIFAWGDSAGGSMVTRMGATGTSGLAGVVGWSAPMNAFQDIKHAASGVANAIRTGDINEAQKLGTALIGLDHSTCLDTSDLTGTVPALSELGNKYRGIIDNPQEFIKDQGKVTELLQDVFNKDNYRTVTNSINGIINFTNYLTKDLPNELKNNFNVDKAKVQSIFANLKATRDSLKTADENFDVKKAVNEKKQNPEIPNNNTELQDLKDHINQAIYNLDQLKDDVRMTNDLKKQLQALNMDIPNDPDQVTEEEVDATKAKFQALIDSLDDYIYGTDASGEPNVVKDIRETNKNKKPVDQKDRANLDDFMAAYYAITDQKDLTAAVVIQNMDHETRNQMATKLNLSDNQRTQFEKIATDAPKLTQQVQQASDVLIKILQAPNSGRALAIADAFAYNSQFMTVRTIARCAQSIIALSPALFADPKSPPMVLVNGQSEYVVPAEDAYVMRDKLNSFGVTSEAVILPGSNHMGCDSRAIPPSVRFIDKIASPIKGAPPETIGHSC